MPKADIPDGYSEDEYLAKICMERLNAISYRLKDPSEYYDRAIKVMKSHLGANPNVYIFSNDQTWCRENISQLLSGANVTFVHWNTGRESYNDMRLMHYCRMNIIAASSFSWWGAYLNQREDQIVVAPKVWINMDLEYDIQLPDWIKV